MARLIININLFIQSGDGVEEEGWYLHNAMIHEGIIYHPECFKDLQKNGELDSSLDTTADSMMDTSTGVIKEEAPEGSDQEMKPVVPDLKLEQPEEMISEPPAPAEPIEMVVETPVSVKEEKPEQESETTEAMELTEEVKTELTDPPADQPDEPTKEVKEEDAEDAEKEQEQEQELEEESSANTSLVGDESHMLAAPVMSQPKVVNLLEGGDWLCLSPQFSSIVIITKIYLSPLPSRYERLLSSDGSLPG